MYRIEFIGVPGSGKTTISKKLIARLKKVDKKQFLSVEEAFLEVSRKKIEKVYRVILNILPRRLALNISNKLLNRNLLQFDTQNKFLAEWGKSFEVFLKSSAFDKMPINDREIVISSFMEIGSLYECISNGCLPGETVVFLEEGFIQKSFMFISPLNNEEAEKTSLFRYLNNIPLPDLILYVNSNLTSCYKRMLARPTGFTNRLRKLEKNEIMDFLKVSDNHFQYVVRCLKKNRAINVFEINNDQELYSVICDLEQRIKSLFDIDITL